MTTTRDFTVATFVVRGDRVLLLYHRKLGMWLPPGGHVEPNEIPDDAAIREVREETGISAELVGPRALPVEAPRQLVRPEGIQLETIRPGHEHIDLVYFARYVEGDVASSDECDRAGWYRLDELESLGATDEIRLWARLALESVPDRVVGSATRMRAQFAEE